MELVYARNGYLQEAITENWRARMLARQIGVLYYERQLSSQDKAAIQQEANRPLTRKPRELTLRHTTKSDCANSLGGGAAV